MFGETLSVSEKEALISEIKETLNSLSDTERGYKRGAGLEERQAQTLSSLPEDFFDDLRFYIPAEIASERYFVEKTGRGSIVMTKEQEKSRLAGRLFEILEQCDVVLQEVITADLKRSGILPSETEVTEKVLDVALHPDRYGFEDELHHGQTPDILWLRVGQDNHRQLRAWGDYKLGELTPRGCRQFGGGFARGLGDVTSFLNSQTPERLQAVNLEELASPENRPIEVSNEPVQVLVIPADRDPRDREHLAVRSDHDFERKVADKALFKVYSGAFGAHEVHIMTEVIRKKLDSLEEVVEIT